MSRKKILCIVIGAICLAGILIAVVLPQYIAANWSLGEAGGCISAVFDKNKVISADKLILRDGEKTVTATDRELVRKIASQFVVANRAGLCGYYDDKWLEIYSGDTLVQSLDEILNS